MVGSRCCSPPRSLAGSLARWFAPPAQSVEDYASLWAMYLVAALAAPLLAAACRRLPAAAYPLLQLEEPEAAFLLSLPLLAASVALHANSFDALHYHRSHEVVSWAIWSTALLLLFDVAAAVLRGWRQPAATAGRRRDVPVVVLVRRVAVRRGVFVLSCVLRCVRACATCCSLRLLFAHARRTMFVYLSSLHLQVYETLATR
jgi:hypothetical protein